MDEAISSVEEATDCTLVEASSEAAATIVVSSWARSAVAVSVPAEASSSVDADDTVSTILPTAPSKSSASLIISALRRRAATWSCSTLASASSRALCSAFSRMTVTVLARSPISSPRPAPGISTSRSPPAILPNAPFRRVIGRATPRKENTTEAISDSDDDDRHDQVDLVGTLGIGHDLVLGGLRILLRASDRRFHQIGDIRGGLDRAVGDDVVL